MFSLISVIPLDDLAPKSGLTNLTAAFRWLEDREIEFLKAFCKKLFGKERYVRSEAYSPTSTDLEGFIEYLPLIGKTIVLCLS
jgi:hypothetical protein